MLISMMINNKRLYKRLILNFSLILFIGFITFFSTTLVYLENIDKFNHIFWTQFLLIIIGLFLFYRIINLKNKNFIILQKNSLFLLILIFLLQFLVFIPGFGVNLNGANRWIQIFGISIQPSEIFKIVLIIFLANVFTVFPNLTKDNKRFMIFFFVLFLFLFLVFALIKDMGSFMIIIVSIISMLLFTHINKIRFFSILFSLFIFLIILGYFFVPHARERVIDFYFHRGDLGGKFYQYNNMIIAVGSGGLTGVGYGESHQKFNRNVPEMISDSIFSIYAEEWGFIGSIVLVTLYWMLFIQIIANLNRIKDNFTQLLVVGLSVNLFFPVFYNILAVLAIVPLSGFPLTFMSKGGTSMVFSIISMAIIILAYK